MAWTGFCLLGGFMDKLKFALLNICVPVAVSVFVFIGIYTNGFCSAMENITASSSAFEVIQGGANKGNGFYYSLTPEMYGTLGPLAIDELNAELYSKYGWDLETIQIDGAEDWTNGVDPQVATQFGYQVTGQTLGDLAQSVIYKISTGLGKMFGLGQKTGDTLSVVHNGAVYYVDENTLDRVKSTRTDLINSGDYTVIDNKNSIYSKHLLINAVRSSTYGDSTVIRLDVSLPCAICYYTANRSGYNNVVAYVPASFVRQGTGGDSYSYYIDNCHGFEIQANGQRFDFNTLKFYSANSTLTTVDINGVTYYYLLLLGGHSELIQSKYSFGSGSNARQTITNATANGNTEKSVATLYRYSNQQDMENLLNQLKGKYVTSEDMQTLIDAINKLQYGVITIDGNQMPVIDTNAESLAQLQALINQILANEQNLADVLNRYNTEIEPEPEPNPIENINQGIDIPTGFDNSLLNPFVDIIKLPFKFFTIFSPVFAIFGSNPLLSLWLFFPSFLIIMIIIWCLK